MTVTEQRVWLISCDGIGCNNNYPFISNIYPALPLDWSAEASHYTEQTLWYCPSCTEKRKHESVDNS